jgi:hypothetical protein
MIAGFLGIRMERQVGFLIRNAPKLRWGVITH